MHPLPPKDPPNPTRASSTATAYQSATYAVTRRAGKALGWSILRGGFLGFGLFAVVLLLALPMAFSRRGMPPGWWLLCIALYVVGALTYGWLRWLFSGRSWRRGSRERAWVRWSRRSLAGLASIVVLFVGLAFLGPRGMALYSTPIRVTGQVVDARTGEPIHGARIYVLGGSTQAQAEQDLTELEEFAAKYPEYREGLGSYGPFGGRATTDVAGRFDLTLRRTYCCAIGPLVARKYPPPFYGARMILVEMDGYRRTFFSTATGTWRVLDQRGAFEVYAVADAQTLRLLPVK